MPDLKTNIIIPVCNKKDYTRQAIMDIFDKTNPGLEWEVTVVDNGSEDGTRNLDCMLWDRINYIRLEKNYGFGAACNDGTMSRLHEEANLLFLNNDVRLPDEWLSRLLFHLEDEKIGIVGPRTNHCSSQQKIPLPNKEEWRALDRHLWDTKEEVCFRVPVITGFCMLVRHDVWRTIGLFDEDTFILSGEDFDYCIRARRAGYDVVVAEGVFVYHYGHVTADDLPDNARKYWRRGADSLRTKWGEDFLKF